MSGSTRPATVARSKKGAIRPGSGFIASGKPEMSSKAIGERARSG